MSLRCFSALRPQRNSFRHCLNSQIPCGTLTTLLSDGDLLAARRAGMLSIGLLSGGYGEDELTRAGAFQVFRDAADLHSSLDELGVLP